MKRWQLAAALALAAGVVSWAQSGKPNEARTPEEELVALERQWLDAEVRGDVAALDKMFAGDFIGTAPGGNIVTKEDIVPPAEYEGRGRFPGATLKETVVRIHGTTAVVMGLVGVAHPTEPGELRFTKVYVKREGRWICVAAHLMRVQSSASQNGPNDGEWKDAGDRAPASGIR
jgi:hypothetical protein